MKGFLLRQKEELTENHFECIEDFYMDSGFKGLTKGLFYEVVKTENNNYLVKSNLNKNCNHRMSNFEKNFKENV